MSNFSFLNDDWANVAKLGKEAEDILYQAPTASLAQLKTFAENLVKIVLQKEGFGGLENFSQLERLSFLKSKEILSDDILDNFHDIRKTGNKAAHEGVGTLGKAIAMLEAAYFIAVWAYQTYGEASFTPKPFEVPTPQNKLSHSIEANNADIILTNSEARQHSVKYIPQDTSNQTSDETEFTIEALKRNGFQGFIRVKELWDKGYKNIPNEPGVYAILRDLSDPPEFLPISVGGRFKNQDPTVSVDVLKAKWVTNAEVLYFGKAGGSKSKVTLKERISLYMKFGQGLAKAHWGGRYIWQLKGVDGLLVAYKPINNEEPEMIEKRMIVDFEKVYGKKPYANLKL